MQARALRIALGLDGDMGLTAEGVYEAVLDRGTAFALANGWRLVRDRCGPHQGRRAGQHRPIGAQALGVHHRNRLVAHPRVCTRRGGARPPTARGHCGCGLRRRRPLSVPPAGLSSFHTAPATGAATPSHRETPMSNPHTLSDRPVFAFCPALRARRRAPAYPPRLRRRPGRRPHHPCRAHPRRAERFCDRRNARLGFGRKAWTALVEHSKRSNVGWSDVDYPETLH